MMGVVAGSSGWAPAGGCLVRLGRAAQPSAAPSGSAPAAACPKPYRSQHPPPQGDDAALRAGNRSPGRPTSHAIGGSPHSDPLHGLDSVEDTRTRHDAPSPDSSAPVIAATGGIRP